MSVYVQFTVRCSFRISSSRPVRPHRLQGGWAGVRGGCVCVWKEGELAEPAGSYAGGGESKSYLQYFAAAAAGEIET